MSKSIWSEARGQALRDTLELARLNDPFRIGTTLGVPFATLAGVWLLSGQLALAAVIGLLALVTLAVATFLVKVIANVARIAEGARAELAARSLDEDGAERERRRAVVTKLVELYVLERGEQVPAAIKAGLELPPEDWLNEQLAERGEEWQIHGIRGTRYSTFEVVAGEWRYRGHRMRSPGAIRWAAFFDALKLDWSVGSENGNPELRIAPDFLLPQLNAWCVVELMSSEAKDAAYQEVAGHTGRRVIVATGLPAWANENLRLFEKGELWEGGLAWAEDRRDDGVYWLAKVDGNAAVCLGGPGKQTDHDRAPLITNRLKAAFDLARQQKIEFERPVHTA